MKFKCLILVVLALALSPLAFTQETSQEAPSRVLHIGDSHSSGHFGWTLNKLLRADDNIQSAFYGVCGAILRHYYNDLTGRCGAYYSEENQEPVNYPSATQPVTPRVKDLIEDFKPDTIIIEISGNYSGYPNATLKADIDKMLGYIDDNNLKCLWVGAPDSRKNTERRDEVVELVKKQVQEKCHFFDSREITNYPASGGDGIHYWGEAANQAKDWAKAVYNRLKEI